MTVRLPRIVQDASTVVIEPLHSTVVILGCGSLPAVCALIADVCRVAVVNNSDKPIEIFAGFFVASVNFVRPISKSSQAAATVLCLPHESTLCKIFHSLNIDSLPDTAPHKQQFLSLVAKYLEIFAECDSEVSTTNLTFHELDIGDVRSLCQPVRRLFYGKMRASVEFAIDKLVSADNARVSTSPWASPVVMVWNKDGGLRMSVDYRRLNSVTKFNCILLPRLNEAFVAFAGATVFSNLDIAMAYYQFFVKPSDIETTFITHLSLFGMQITPFGLCNAPSTYKQLMARVLRKHWSHLFRVPRRCDRYIEETLGARCRFSRRIRQNSLCWSEIEAVEVLIVCPSGTVPRSRHLGSWRILQSCQAACTRWLSDSKDGSWNAVLFRIRNVLRRLHIGLDWTYSTTLRCYCASKGDKSLKLTAKHLK